MYNDVHDIWYERFYEDAKHEGENGDENTCSDCGKELDSDEICIGADGDIYCKCCVPLICYECGKKEDCNFTLCRDGDTFVLLCEDCEY